MDAQQLHEWVPRFVVDAAVMEPTVLTDRATGRTRSYIGSAADTARELVIDLVSVGSATVEIDDTGVGLALIQELAANYPTLEIIQPGRYPVHSFR